MHIDRAQCSKQVRVPVPHTLQCTAFKQHVPLASQGASAAALNGRVRASWRSGTSRWCTGKLYIGPF